MYNGFTFREMAHEDVKISLPTDVASHGAVIIVADSVTSAMARKMGLGLDTSTTAFHASGD
jgi:hypothetical protein